MMSKEFQSKFIQIQTSLVAPKGQFNAFGKYKYRSCEDILEALKPLLKQHGLSLVITDAIVQVGDRYYVKSTATISDGEFSVSNDAFARESELKKGMDESQITGATSSYARKYALNGLFCIDDTKDADTKDNKEEEASKLQVLFNEVIAVQKAKFKSAEDRKAWFDKRGLKTSIKEMTESQLSDLLDLLNE